MHFFWCPRKRSRPGWLVSSREMKLWRSLTSEWDLTSMPYCRKSPSQSQVLPNTEISIYYECDRLQLLYNTELLFMQIFNTELSIRQDTEPVYYMNWWYMSTTIILFMCDIMMTDHGHVMLVLVLAQWQILSPVVSLVCTWLSVMEQTSVRYSPPHLVCHTQSKWWHHGWLYEAVSASLVHVWPNFLHDIYYI